jgi:hypothetical protein
MCSCPKEISIGSNFEANSDPVNPFPFPRPKKKSVGPPGPETLDDAVAEGSLESEPLAVA